VKSKIFSIFFALVLVVTLGLVTAVPAAAADPPALLPKVEFQKTGASAVDWSTAEKKFGEWSVLLSLATPSDEARVAVVIPGSPNFDALTGLGYWYYIKTAAHDTVPDAALKDSTEPDFVDFTPVPGYAAPYAVIELDKDGNGTPDVWVVEARYADDSIEAWEQRSMNTSNYFHAAGAGVPAELALPNIATLATIKGNSFFAGAKVLKVKVMMGSWGAYITDSPEAYVDDVDVDFGSTTYALEPRVINTTQTKGYNTIQAAITAADSSDTISVAAGTYNEDVTINKSLTLQGENRETTEIKFGYSSYPSASPLTISADGVTVSGFTIRSGPYIEPSWTITVEGDSTLLTNLKVVKEPLKWANNTPKVAGAATFVSPNVAGFTLTDSTIDSAWNGIYSREGASNVIIRNVSFTYPGEYAILLKSIIGATVTRNTFRCTNAPSSCGVIVTRGSDDIVIEENQFIGFDKTKVRHVGILLQAYAAGDIGRVDIFKNEISNFNIGVEVENVATPGIHINFNKITGNTYGVNNLAPSAVDATMNWWGHATGADHAINPHGTGKGGGVVSNNVTFIPWYATSTTTPDTQYVSVDHESSSTIAYSDTIQGGIDAALAGDTVIVAKGTYPGDIRIGKALTVRSTAGAEKTIIDGTGSYIVIISHSDVTFRGFTVTNPEYAGGADASGILVEYVSGEPISNVQILDNIVTRVRSETGTPSTYGATGINIGNAPLSNVVISGNTITNIKNPEGGASDHTCGINVWDGTDGVVIRNNTISDIKYNGIILECASNVRIEENVITGCKTGIRVEPYEGATVSNVTVNLNNILGNVTYGVYNGGTGTLNATRNWWGAATGPYHATLNPVANMGNAVSDNVVFSPWLYKTQETIVPTREPAYAQSVVLDNFGAFAWNTFSAPIFLDGSADTWKELYDLTLLDYNMAYRFDLATQRFVGLAIDSDYAINPGEGFFIKMNTAGSLPILYSTEDNLMPSSRPLIVGWNLIGLANMEDMEVRAALFSLAGDGQVVSPTGNINPGAVPAGRAIYVGEGYWAYMLHERTLVGFTTTPVNWIP